MFDKIFANRGPTLKNQWTKYLEDASYTLYCRFIRSLIDSRTRVKLKMFGEQHQSPCHRVNCHLTVLDSKRTFLRIFNRHYLDIKYIE